MILCKKEVYKCQNMVAITCLCVASLGETFAEATQYLTVDYANFV